VEGAIKDPKAVRRGRLGARARWDGHSPRVVSLGSFTAEQRRLILALVDAAKAETQKAAPVVSETSTETASAEGHGNDRSAA
jgi:hypothetical protein